MSALPRSIRAVAPTGPGGPEVLQLQERPLPPLASGQVLIKVGYAGVNRHDCTQRKRGTPPPGATDVFGLEVSGTIVAASADVPGTRIGQRVCALINGGGYADYCVAEAALALEYPASLSEAEAAALPEALFTFWFNVFELGGLKADQWLLVHGGTSGVASLGIQVAKALGARVAVTAGTEAKCTACRKLGADLVINYRDSDFVEAMKQVGGANVILDQVGGLYAQRNIDALAMDGKLVHLTSAQTPTFSATLESISRKRAVVTSSMMRPLELPRKIAVARQLLDQVWPLLGKGIRPLIDSIHTLQEAALAHARMDSGVHAGKILLRP
jgi:NADPH2:quinone reductase